MPPESVRATSSTVAPQDSHVGAATPDTFSRSSAVISRRTPAVLLEEPDTNTVGSPTTCRAKTPTRPGRQTSMTQARTTSGSARGSTVSAASTVHCTR